MKPGDTFRIGGIPVVVVADGAFTTERACTLCAFKTCCSASGSEQVSAIERWLGGDCITDRVHYEVRQ